MVLRFPKLCVAKTVTYITLAARLLAGLAFFTTDFMHSFSLWLHPPPLESLKKKDDGDGDGEVELDSGADASTTLGVDVVMDVLLLAAPCPQAARMNACVL